MKKKDFYNIIEKSSSVSELSKENLNEITNQFPWFASAHLLKAKQALLQNHSEFENILSTSAVYSNNRVALFELIYPSSHNKSIKPDNEFPELKSKNNVELNATSAPVEVIENNNSKTEELLDIIIEKEKTAGEKQTAEVFEEMIIASEIESNFQISDSENDELIVAGGDHEEVGMLAVENAARNNSEEHLIEEIEAVSQSGNMVEFVKVEIDEDADEPEIDKNDVELASTIFLDEEIEASEKEEEVKDAEVELLSLSEFSHKNEEIESDEEGSSEENIDSELESLKVLEAQNATEILIEEDIAVSDSLENNDEHSFLDWLKKYKDNKKPEEVIAVPEIENQAISEAFSAQKEAEEEALIDFTPDLLSTNNEEDLRVIDNFVHSIKEKKAELKTSSVIDRAERSLENSNEIVTETLAKILTAQNKYQSAISMYEKLSLKLPDKSHYFAALINELKNKL